MSNKTGREINLLNESFYLEGYKDYYNKRLKIEDIRGDLVNIVDQINRNKDSYVEKIIVKSRYEQVQALMEQGFVLEAVVPQYFLGSDMFFLCKYASIERYNSDKWCEEDDILEAVYKKKYSSILAELDSNLTLRLANEADAVKLSTLYASVFKIYPVPIENPDYIKQQMNLGTIFMIVERGSTIIAAASAEINLTYMNAEITDCATLPDNRGGGYMKHIILALEKELVKKQIFCSYSIARSLSFGMNATLQALSYSYSGRLKNNCYIYNNIEDMNVWNKNLTNGSADYSASSAES
ncbi:N-acetyltransferase YodP [Bacillus sp. THAF10]|uniref:putative beta-lysine N-acetyltransferase n=1 Tax=Bacillus sp. THAF10 TaxID=2587848 RepID=UPI0012A898C9|nr:putative beta-lysine N-acetyltransferase [Bacillus sp. THAF10]QFT89259.1 N-acetyltransferase YodP [Bacillus sp. THAF10]